MDTDDMTDVKRRLFDAFRLDHARLGRALYLLDERIAASDAAGARAVSERLDAEAGAHVAFEEEDFYPALAPFLSPEEIDAMYAEHATGRTLLETLAALEDGALADAERRATLTAGVRALETHVSECGELFGAMGGLDESEQRRLLERLERWRELAPRWRELPPRRATATEAR